VPDGSLSFRRLRGSDAGALLLPYCEYLREFRHEGPEREIHAFLSELLAQSWIVAAAGFRQHEVLAFAIGSLSYSAIRRCKALLLSDVYVAPRLRGRGAARDLLAHVYEECRSIGVERLFGNVEPTTRNFFLRKGWRPSHQAYLVYDLQPPA
jgi:GNAT superfamily N-acetyltransferase